MKTEKLRKLVINHLGNDEGYFNWSWSFIERIVDQAFTVIDNGQLVDVQKLMENSLKQEFPSLGGVYPRIITNRILEFIDNHLAKSYL